MRAKNEKFGKIVFSSVIGKDVAVQDFHLNQQTGNSSESMKQTEVSKLLRNLTPEKSYELLRSTYFLFENWPDEFFAKFEEYVEQIWDYGYGRTVIDGLSSFFEEAFGDRPDKYFGTLIHELLWEYIFSRYIATSENDVLTYATDFSGEGPLPVLSIPQTARLFGAKQSDVISSIQSVNLKAVNYVEPNLWIDGYGTKELQMTVAVDSTLTQLGQFGNLVSADTIANFLGLDKQDVIGILETKIIRSEKNPRIENGVYPTWLVDLKDLRLFWQKLLSLCNADNNREDEIWLGYALSLHVLQDNLPTLLLLLFSGRLEIRRQGNETGINQFKFSLSSLKRQKAYIEFMSADPITGKLQKLVTVDAAAKHIHSTKEWIYRRIDEGYLNLADVRRKGLKGDYIFLVHIRENIRKFAILKRDPLK